MGQGNKTPGKGEDVWVYNTCKGHLATLGDNHIPLNFSGAPSPGSMLITFMPQREE